MHARLAPPVRRALACAMPLLLALPSTVRAQSPDSAEYARQTRAAKLPKDRLSLDTYLEWEDVQSPQLSPDGRQVIYTRRWVDKLNDRWESSLWIMSADGSRNRFLVNGSNAKWSPDGSRVAYFAKGEPSGTQLFVRYMDADGASTQITRLTETPADLAWSPDGKWIAFRQLVLARDNWRIDLPPAPKGAKWVEPPRVVQKVEYRRDRQGYVDDGFRHIFVVPADGGTPRQVTSGDWDHGAPEWTPDGARIVFSALRVEDADYSWRESEIYSADVASGAIAQLTHRKGPDQDPAMSPDGKLIAYTGFDSTDATWVDSRLYVMNADGSAPRALTEKLDRSPQGIMWAPDGAGVYFNVESEGSRNLYYVPLRGGEPRAVTRGQQVLTVSDVGRGGLAVGVNSTPRRPNEVVSVSLTTAKGGPAAGTVRTLAAVNDDVLTGKKLATVEEIWYPSVDGYRVQGWVVKPPDFDPSKKYPLMLTIHGGPHSMYNTAFNFAWQEHAANGYVVLYTNPRGSTGYGSAFGNAIKNAYPGKDYDDLMAGVDTVIGRGYVDPQNMFVYGCSGGGVLTAWIVGHTDRFAAASSNCPVINWVSFVGTTDGGVFWYNNFEKRPWEDPSEHLRRSPLMYVGNVKTPTMLMTGVNDLRTPISQTEEFYQALKLRKVPTAMIRFNDEWHGTSSRPSNFMRTQLYLRSWFERYARKGSVAAVTP
ncbi:MAG TPA: S9 family peptidase [Gemmatimonadaceae bacterium]|nr:S9 family peptidase [Gemmatimonadaceae bacterium]